MTPKTWLEKSDPSKKNGLFCPVSGKQREAQKRKKKKKQKGELVLGKKKRGSRGGILPKGNKLCGVLANKWINRSNTFRSSGFETAPKKRGARGKKGGGIDLVAGIQVFAQGHGRPIFGVGFKGKQKETSCLEET